MISITDLAIYEDNDLIVLNKPYGLAVQTEEVGVESIEQMCKRDLDTYHFITRIDQAASGIVLIAKSEAGIRRFTHLQDQKSIKKLYTVIVEGKLVLPNATLTHYLSKKGNKAYVSDNKQGKVSTLAYEVVSELDNYSILKVELDTGRFHQIRCQMSHIGHPIKGDVKYGSRRGNRFKGIYLHSRNVIIQDYLQEKEVLTLQAPYPNEVLWNFCKS